MLCSLEEYLSFIKDTIPYVKPLDAKFNYMQKLIYKYSFMYREDIYLNETVTLINTPKEFTIIADTSKEILDNWDIAIHTVNMERHQLVNTTSNFIHTLEFLFARDNYIEANFVQIL